MVRSWRKLGSVWTLAAILLVLLPLLAVLQHRWLDRLSEWERERTGYLLRTGTESLGRELDTRVEPVFRTFQLMFEPGSADELADRFRAACDLIQGKVDDDLGALVADLYWVAPPGEDPPLFRYDVGTGSLAAVSLPPRGDPLGEALAALPADPAPPIGRIPVLSVDGSPLLAVAIQRPGAMEAPGWVLVRLNETYLRERLFPAAFARHFGGEGAPEFEVAVFADTSPATLLYASRDGLSAADFATCDATADLFRLEQALLVVARPPTPDAPAAAAAPAGSPAPEEPAGPDGSRAAADSVASRDPAGTAPVRAAAAFGPDWTVRVRHVAGSLEAAISGARRRNLLVAYGILVLLAASAALLVLAARRARRLARMRLAFIAGISHELRSPLAVIASAGENLADAVVDTPEGTRAYGDLIRREGRRLQGMVDRVIRLASCQSGTAGYAFAAREPVPVLESACAACATELEESGCTLRRSFPDDLPPVTVDADAVATAVANLLGNAIKHGGPGREIGIEADLVTRRGRREIRIGVRDSGPGIAPEELETVFEPFRRTTATRAAQVPGSGLGLSLVREIARAHGGRCTARNLDGGGCLFTLHLPLADPAGGRETA